MRKKNVIYVNSKLGQRPAYRPDVLPQRHLHLFRSLQSTRLTRPEPIQCGEGTRSQRGRHFTMDRQSQHSNSVVYMFRNESQMVERHSTIYQPTREGEGNHNSYSFLPTHEWRGRNDPPVSSTVCHTVGIFPISSGHFRRPSRPGLHPLVIWV